MMNLLILWLVSAVCLYVTAVIVPGFHLRSFSASFIAVAVVGLLNALLRPVLILLTLPINIITLGIFTFVVNAIILRVAAGLLKGFDIDGWFSAIIGAIVLALIHAFFFSAVGPSQADGVAL